MIDGHRSDAGGDSGLVKVGSSNPVLTAAGRAAAAGGGATDLAEGVGGGGGGDGEGGGGGKSQSEKVRWIFYLEMVVGLNGWYRSVGGV